MRRSKTEQFNEQMYSAFASLPDWLKETKDCDCWYHRYGVAHICECGALYDHSQGSCDEHRDHDCISFDSGFVRHGDTAKIVFDRLMFFGLLPYGTPAFEKVYDFAANNW